MRISSVTVGEEAVEVAVAFEAGEPLRTAAYPGLAEHAVALLPGLGGHRCVNDDGRSFADELQDTELAHLLEHVALELMALSGSPRSLRGWTSWDFAADGRGVFHVSLQYDDDLVCLGAIRGAREAVAYLAGGGEAPDIAGVVDALEALRDRPALTVAEDRC